jgi:hypothetical protein
MIELQYYMRVIDLFYSNIIGIIPLIEKLV